MERNPFLSGISFAKEDPVDLLKIGMWFDWI